jgi:hypothetical protein
MENMPHYVHSSGNKSCFKQPSSILNWFGMQDELMSFNYLNGNELKGLPPSVTTLYPQIVAQVSHKVRTRV